MAKAAHRAQPTSQSPAETAPRIRGLLVGINRFRHLPSENQLQGCVRDTENLTRLLTGTYAARPNDLHQLHDDRATRDAVLSRLAELVAVTKAGDVAVFHISTHGALLTFRESTGSVKDHASEVLCLADITPELDDPETYITDNDLAAVLSKLKPGALFIAVIDACHSGASRIAREVGSTRRNRCLAPPLDLQHRDEARRALAQGKDYRHRLFERAARTSQAHVLVLTACGTDETSDDADFGSKKNPRYEGAFTHFLCDVLTRRPQLNYASLLAQVQRALRDNGDRQTPEFMPSSYDAQIVFAPLNAIQRPTPDGRRRLKGSLRVGNKEILLSPGQMAQPDRLPDDPRYAALLHQLYGCGFHVQDLPAGEAGEEVVLRLESDHAALLLEYRDGLAIWSKPSSQGMERIRDIKPGAAEKLVADGVGALPVTKCFRIRPLPPRRHADRGLVDDVQRVFHVVLHPLETVTRAIVMALEKLKFSEALWTLTNSFGGSQKNPTGRLPAPDPDNPQAVLFIHGVLSSLEDCFDKPGMRELLAPLGQRYILLGYNHLSATVSVREIAHQLDSRLRECLPPNTRLNIVAHSQGGVIARQLGEFRDIHRIVTFGSPHQGTHLANSLDQLVTVLGALPLPSKGLTFLFDLLKFIDSPDVIPGFLDMRVDSQCIATLNAATNVATSFFCASSDFKPDPQDGVLVRLAEELDAAALFQNRDNDLVIDTQYMRPPEAFHLADTISFGTDAHIMHTEYFEQQQSVEFIRRILLQGG